MCITNKQQVLGVNKLSRNSFLGSHLRFLNYLSKSSLVWFLPSHLPMSDWGKWEACANSLYHLFECNESFLSFYLCLFYWKKLFRLTESETLLFKSKELNNFNSHLSTHRFYLAMLSSRIHRGPSYPSISSINLWKQLHRKQKRLTLSLWKYIHTSISIKERWEWHVLFRWY